MADLPRVILHNAVSVDGRIDRFFADIGKFYELAMGFGEDATLAGSDTILAITEKIPREKPSDFAPAKKEAGDRRPILVIPDSGGRVRTWHYWKRQPYWRDWVALVTKSTPKAYLKYLKERGIHTISSGAKKVDMKKALSALAKKFKVRSVRADSGGTLNGVLLRAGLVDEVSLLIHPALVGGDSVKSMFRAPDLDDAAGVIALELINSDVLKNGLVWLRYRVAKTGR